MGRGGVGLVGGAVCMLTTVPVSLHADHPAKGGVAGIQLSSGCRWALYLHSGGT